MSKGKMVANREAVGATVNDVDWTTVTLTTQDGRILEIRAEIGHSGVELNVYETKGSA